MSGIKLVLLGLVGALMMSAMAAGTASAASETRFFVEQAEVKGTEKVKIEGTSAASKLESEIAGVKIVIECKKDTFKGEIEKEGLSSGEIKFEECGNLFQRNAATHAREELGTCAVESPITFKFKDKLIPGPGGSAEDEFEPEVGEVFVKIKINTCTLKGTYEPKGKQVCALPEAEFELVTHEIWCTSTGSKLKLAKGAEAPLASFTSIEKVNTEGGKKWRG